MILAVYPAAPASTLPMPCHDPPVGWRQRWGGVTVVVCPAMDAFGGYSGLPPYLIGKIPANLAVLDEEPGRLG